MSHEVELLLNGEYVGTKDLSDECVEDMLTETAPIKVRFPVKNITTTFKAMMYRTPRGLSLQLQRIH